MPRTRKTIDFCKTLFHSFLNSKYDIKYFDIYTKEFMVYLSNDNLSPMELKELNQKTQIWLENEQLY